MKISLFILYFSLAITSFANQDSHLEKEEALHRIYKNYNVKPTPTDVWKNLIQANSTQTYTIQDGDTLWDLSATLFGDPNYWPKIWSLNNPEVLNPHEIRRNQVVHFTEGTFGEAPQLALKEQSENQNEPGSLSENAESAAVGSEADSSSDEPSGVVSDQELPPLQIKSVEHNNLPQSFPSWSPSKGSVAVYNMQLKPFEKPSPPAEPFIDYYVADSFPDYDGEVEETDMLMGGAATEQFIYVKFLEIPSEKYYHVIKSIGMVKDKFGNKGQAHFVQVLGEVEILEKVSSTKNIYRAKVTRNIDHVYVGGKLRKGPAPTANPVETTSGIIKAQIIGGHFGEGRLLFAEGSIVFLNAGLSDGVVLGQKLNIYKNNQLRNANTKARSVERKTGALRVVKVGENFSTAIVTSSIEDIQAGDLTYQRASD